MIFLSLPIPGPFGWGVFAENVTANLKSMTDVITPVPPETDYPLNINHATLHAIQGVNLLPLRPAIRSSVKNVGACFIEDNLLVGRYAPNAKRYFDHIVAGSDWGREILRQAGVGIPTSVAIQGVGEQFFQCSERVDNDGRFIVFSGGKAESRKGQDIVVRAMKVMMDRHADVWLALSWDNPWRTPGCEEILDLYHQLMDLTRCIVSHSGPHSETWKTYYASDIGLFPNRAEAGTNLVMMEYMACARPVIATYATGHIDVLEGSCDLNLRAYKPAVHKDASGQATGLWAEPNLEEVIEKLEWAYQHRGDTLWIIGGNNRNRMQRFTWQRCAQEFLNVLTKT